MSTFSISGKIIRQSNRKPIPKLYIEVWDKDGSHKEMLGSTISDSEGAFTLSMDEGYIGELYKDRYPDVYFKIFAGSILVSSTENTAVVNLHGNTTGLI